MVLRRTVGVTFGVTKKCENLALVVHSDLFILCYLGVIIIIKFGMYLFIFEIQ